ncbi:AAA family ATPase [Sphaerimonospora cavernae]|uniref:AAA family ATPase n=1 Tax=Sphaerimonospora cavernae TaxID=1740611 RepID=A0ABV6U0V1_9ACTN
MSDKPEYVAPFISRVRVRDFRSIAECDVILGPLTVIVGPNAAGKSNFLDAIRFVVDSLAESPSQAISRRGGLPALLRRTPRADGDAVGTSFMVELTLAVSAKGSRSQPSAATYLLEIDARPGRNGDIVVGREELLLKVGKRSRSR